MRIGVNRLAAISGAMVLCLGIPAFGQGTPVTMSLTSVSGDPIVAVGGQLVHAGVYGGTSSLAGAQTGIICDDFKDTVTVGETWTANAYQVSTLGTSTSPLSDVLFGGSHTPAYANVGLAGYAEMAFLANLSFNSAGNSTLQSEISEAIWSITDPGLSGTGVGTVAHNLVLEAIAYANSTHDSLSQYANLWIYTPGPNTGKAGEAQEMWGRGSVPEGGASLAYLLLAGISCFGAICFRFRSQSGTCESA